MSEPLREQFLNLLQSLFYLNEPDLDFGIYRIIRYRREEILRFINQDLVGFIQEHLPKLTRDAPKAAEPEGEVYNHLIRFFSRYYHGGDFIPQRRYGKKHKYILPYNGEEIAFYWINHDQYFIKSSPFFQSYRFTHDGWEISFRIVQAEAFHGNIKSTHKQYFFLSRPAWEIQENQLHFYFEFRSPKEAEREHFGKITQKHINASVLEAFRNSLPQLPLPGNVADDFLRTLAEHLSRFTRKNEQDYFIHKDLANFLITELDFYIKSEIFNFDNFPTLTESNLRYQLHLATIVHTIAAKVIEMLGQIEDFQKQVWEKRSFVLSTDYVISLSHIQHYAGNDLWGWVVEQLADNTAQLREWRDLFGFHFDSEVRETLEMLLYQPTWQHLPIDTRFFDESFKVKLLEGLSANHRLADIIDGYVWNSENWTALNTISPLLKEKIKCIYIDPPFNKEQEADYLYKVGYKDSTWITMLENRVSLAHSSLRSDGCLFLRCDYNGTMYARLMLDRLFGKDNFRNEIIVNRTLAKQQVDTQFTVKTETLFLYAKSPRFKPNPVERPTPPRWYPLLHFPRKDERPRKILGRTYYPPRNRRWALSQQRIDRLIARNKVRINPEKSYVDCFGNTIKGVPELLYDSEMVGNEWLDIPGYAQRHHFATENAEALLQRVIESSTMPGEWVMDFFLGSGTTIAVAQKMKRKWVGVEMGEHFYSVILPRMKKVLHGDPGKISRDLGWEGGGFFCYQGLEQFEDALENITFGNSSNMLTELPDYTVRYMLSSETRQSPTFLNINRMRNPFEYKLNLFRAGGSSTATIDLVQTFVNWLGIEVEQVFARPHQNRRYLFVTGKLQEQPVVTIWRVADNLDYEAEKQFLTDILREYSDRRVFINGDCALAGVESIEGVMKESSQPVF